MVLHGEYIESASEPKASEVVMDLVGCTCDSFSGSFQICRKKIGSYFSSVVEETTVDTEIG